MSMVQMDRLERRRLLAGLNAGQSIPGIDEINLSTSGTMFVKTSDEGVRVRWTVFDANSDLAERISGNAKSIPENWIVFIYVNDRPFTFEFGAQGMGFVRESDAFDVVRIVDFMIGEQPIAFLEVWDGKQSAVSGQLMVPLAFVRRFTVEGGAGDDEIVVNAKRKTTIRGLGGHDTLRATGRNAFLDGGPGRDVLTTTGSGATVLGGSGNDTIFTGVGVDWVFGGRGIDRLFDDTDIREAVEVIG